MEVVLAAAETPLLQALHQNQKRTNRLTPLMPRTTSLLRLLRLLIADAIIKRPAGIGIGILDIGTGMRDIGTGIILPLNILELTGNGTRDNGTGTRHIGHAATMLTIKTIRSIFSLLSKI